MQPLPAPASRWRSPRLGKGLGLAALVLLLVCAAAAAGWVWAIAQGLASGPDALALVPAAWPLAVAAVAVLGLAAAAALARWRRMRRETADTLPASTVDTETPRDSLIDELSALVLQLDPSGAITYVNRHWEVGTGLTAQHVLGRHLPDLCQPAGRARVEALLLAPAGHAHGPVIVRLATPRGDLTLELSLEATRNEAGQVTGHTGFAVEVAGRQAARERLQDQLDFAIRLLDISPTPLFAKDTHHRFIEVNRAWLDMTGLPLNHVLGQTETSLFGDPTGRIEASDQHVLDSGERVSYEVEWTAADGSRRDTLVTKARLTRGDGDPAGIVGSVADITAYRQAERATRAARDASVQAAKAKIEFERNFLSMAAHELRTPLTSLRLQGELIAGAPNPDEQQAHTAELITSIDRVSHVLDQLMILSRVDGLKYTALDRTDIDLEATYFKAMSLLQDEAAERGMRMKASLRGIHVPGIEFGVYTIVRNLLHNAILYTPTGGRIAISATVADSGEVALVVDDSGPGIPADQRDRAFDRFQRLGQQTVRGSGLGLSIVKTIASLHGASVQLDTSPLGGLQVSVVFPAQAPAVHNFLDSDLAPLQDLRAP